MKKIPNWELEFDALLNRKLFTPFQWGSWDCVHFTNAFIKAMTEESLLPVDWIWKNEEEAMKSIFRYGKDQTVFCFPS